MGLTHIGTPFAALPFGSPFKDHVHYTIERDDMTGLCEVSQRCNSTGRQLAVLNVIEIGMRTVAKTYTVQSVEQGVLIHEFNVLTGKGERFD
jgi:hypothetical protein